MGLIKGSLVEGDKTKEFEIISDFPVGERNSMVVAVNPTDWSYVMSLAWGKKVYQSAWRCDNKNYELFFVLPDIPCGIRHVMGKVRNWISTSDSSKSLYPWWVNMPAVGADLICQIHPKGCSSDHFHRPEEGIRVAETYWPILNDGGTMIRVNGQKPQPLKERRDILPNERHQLVREGDGFSIQMLIMNSRRYRFPCKDGHCICQP
jgi:hypothetical protein